MRKSLKINKEENSFVFGVHDTRLDFHFDKELKLSSEEDFDKIHEFISTILSFC